MVANPHTFGLGHMHSFFCIGALASPLICQTLIARGWPWQNFYYLSVTIPVINFFTVLMTFRSSLSEFLIDKEKAITGGISLQRIVRGDVPEGSVRPTVAGATAVDVEPSEGATTPKQSSRHNLPRNMFMTTVKTPTVWAFGFFISMYTGSEGVTSGYIVTYLLKMRSADPSVVGYANSAFWAGAAVGRLALGYTSPLMGRRKPYWIFAFIIFAMSFHLCIWFIPSFAIGWAMTALAGLSMGPVFPLSLEIASRNLSPAIISSALAIMSSMGNLGGAFYPFMTGLLSNAEGEKVIEPLVVSLLGTMFCFWAVTRAHFSYK
ncbi:hypothetical protein M408DRAFT_333783 [Serendipita vermifera MAFF 305830]|uniref:Major facilitator superfamily (MFS) profile domain-containing protein n=1 Tax=Serendipita vermifera MAFF 305830 TaxID=933852 RepID=A0A0C3ALC1_SERVB|nr:hypothetical protein M408DRAFT_333783 [Serendipita vermifera MAFF 305830]